ncbi:hypothetical protein ACQ4PT_001796 [Festuca glaucescens]
MRPILMKGHERPLTFLKYNRDGDLLFSCAKDHTPTVWSPTTATASAPTAGTTARFDAPARSVDFAIGDHLAVITTDSFMGNMPTAQVKRIAEDLQDQTDESALVISGITGRINRAVWGPGNRTIITAGEDATIRIWDSETGKLLKESGMEEGHQKAISSLSKSADWSHFLTAMGCKNTDPDKDICHGATVNAVDISPTLDHVVIGGGQDAMNVTMTDRRAGKFEAKFFHKILQEEIGGVKGHFGPINALAFNPDGRSFSSGGEDGYVRLHHFDPEYFNIKM